MQRSPCIKQLTATAKKCVERCLGYNIVLCSIYNTVCTPDVQCLTKREEEVRTYKKFLCTGVYMFMCSCTVHVLESLDGAVLQSASVR